MPQPTTFFVLLALLGVAACHPQPAAAPATYAMEDFARVRKFDAHVHANDANPALLQQAALDNFELLSINVDYPAFPPVHLQHQWALQWARRDPSRFHWAVTFTLEGFGQPGWADTVNANLQQAVHEGARAVKIWKNVGMVQRQADGRLLMINDPALGLVATQVERLGVPLILHQGEPYNSWLPLAEMSTGNDRQYFAMHPQYHMFLHPDMPLHADLMDARARFMQAHPALPIVGAHLGSLEYDVDVLAAFLDRFPTATVDLAARISQVQHQSIRDPGKVRDFFIRYQDRLLYGSDLTQPPGAEPAAFRAEAHQVWLSDWRYLATAESQVSTALPGTVPGLALPRTVIDKIYYSNAVRVFRARAEAAQAPAR